ncbi:MAG TPA: cupin domain-containing protein [Sporichthyaceae bacterium]|nr:cupin domain-containing protein [Sporichthyaceae bacterium]
MRRSVTIAGTVGLVAVLGTVAVTAARASGGSGKQPVASPIVKTEIAKAVLEQGSGDVTFHGGKETSVINATFAPGASTGWHHHPGTGMFIVNSGTLTTYGLDGEACTPVPMAAGKSLLFSAHAHHAHLVRNETTEPVTITVLYFDLDPGQAGRADSAAPAGCPALK